VTLEIFPREGNLRKAIGVRFGRAVRGWAYRGAFNREIGYPEDVSKRPGRGSPGLVTRIKKREIRKKKRSANARKRRGGTPKRRKRKALGRSAKGGKKD